MRACHWQDSATLLMQLDIAETHAEACCLSRLERARWIIGDGRGNAFIGFSARLVGNHKGRCLAPLCST